MLMEVFLTSFALSVLKGMTLLVSYINNNSFPHPLSKEDETRYFQILQRGHTDSDSDSDSNLDVIDEIINVEQARTMLIEHNMRLVAYIVKKFGDTEEKNEDLFSIGMIGLIKAIDTFKPAIGVKLSSYATRCITNEIFMNYRKDRGKSETSLYKPLGEDDSGNELTIIDSLEADLKPIPDQIINEEDHRILLESVDKLPPLCRQVLQMRYGLTNSPERSQQEVADTLRISRSYVSRIEKKAIQKLIQEMKESRP
ncbi:RNA polymerase sporulation sigma factor SigK [Desulfosporosinus sp. Sb-LF]|uniref:RNA polymerase sporulation sigma factor SigK n=1 Tax=Desulfosporosinus sp. Sb-LF TaxID=2560027 RepID=UPI00107F202F|nr:RNA polymerase sporulation sigma factor SigK [Desulfosporosinus sp. Sb-LF]TGE31393.1 sigma-70 family RNA polymerase sigma factor [Desulfosporosinus sp. Sb-LF]